MEGYVLFITSALGGGKQSSLHNPPLHQRENNANYAIYRQLSGPHSWPKCHAKDKSLSLMGSETWLPTQQPNPYTDWAILLPPMVNNNINININPIT